MIATPNAKVDTGSELRELFRSRTPLVDVRAPIEFRQGSLPGSVNLPLLEDDERAAVGTTYKKHGTEAAVALGHEFVSGAEKQRRVAAWTHFVRTHPRTKIYCFRGGLRSHLVRDVLREAGLTHDLIEGGYKRVRSFLMEETIRVCAKAPFSVISGMTGSGKTRLLRSVLPRRSAQVRICDLEHLAQHRGSAFGKSSVEQPSQADFENRLACTLMQLNDSQDSQDSQDFQARPILIEDESRMIGKCTLPAAIFARLLNGPIYVLEKPIVERALDLACEYLTETYGLAASRTGSLATLRSDVLLSLNSIKPRIGGAAHHEIQKLFEQSLLEHEKTQRFECHVPWVVRLLETYYDPLYTRHLERESSRIIFRGGESELLARLERDLELGEINA